MDKNKILIIIKGEDKTTQNEKIESDIYKGKYKIKYNSSDTIYSYEFNDVIIEKYAEEIDITNKNIYYKNQTIFDVEKVIRFQRSVKIIYKNGTEEIFLKGEEITVKKSPNKQEEKNRDIIKYYRQIAKYAKVKDEKQVNNNNKTTFLEKEYNKLNYIQKDSILDYFINKRNLKSPKNKKEEIIYPFRFNLSQKEAINNIYKSNISIIEGPPGTGKTQTILNIIANLAIMQDKTVAVVSNNNEAVKNVKDKLTKSGYEFILADLGKKEKREKFFENLPQPKISGFKIDEKEKKKFETQIKRLNIILNKLLEKKNRQAELKKQLNEYKLEQQYFEEYYKEQNIKEINKLDFYNKTDDRIIQFLIDTQMKNEGKVKFDWIYEIKMLLKYRIKNLQKLDENSIENILMLQKEYYEIKIEKVEKELDEINKILKKHKFEKLQEKHQIISEKLFKNKIYNKYIYLKSNKYTFKNYQKDIKGFVKQYPVVLSTTYSLRNCVTNDFMFDYVIIDESSQVDLLTGALAISCAKNAIIVGDTKQLKQIVDTKIKEKVSSEDIDICHNYFENNILTAMLRIYENKIPRKILREHYRCHPKIIEFCNKRYYNGELIAFANEEHKSIQKPLILYYTAKGNHLRKIDNGEKKGTFNERELEVIKEEILNDTRTNKYKDKDIGITTPYRMQADIMQDIEKNIESDTIHKFQGREKKLMILSTVLDGSRQGKQGLNFVDEASMVNVAVSRAIDQFAIVTDNKFFNENGKEIKALLKYIKYNEMDSEIVESQIVSVFDLLYKEYSEKLDKLSKSLLNRRKYRSEQIMDTILYNELVKDEYIDYEYTGECLLKELLKSTDNLNEREKEFINNRASIDFVIFDKMDKKPRLLIEVDGFEYHENKTEQIERDKLKNEIVKKNNLKLLRFETGRKSYNEEKIIGIIRKELNIEKENENDNNN